jgi:hypothetical protein
MPLVIFNNPDIIVEEEFAQITSIPPIIFQKIKSSNRRIEFIEQDNFSFSIIHIPEYDKQKKMIVQVELDICYEKDQNQGYLFFFDSIYFSSKYNESFKNIKYSNYGELFYQVLRIVQIDEQSIIEHILLDTNTIKEEYYSKISAEILIRHLTNNQINISGLKLILSNQSKSIESAKQYLKPSSFEQLEYFESEIKDELTYANEFSGTLMNSIDTKFEVKTSNDIYIWTKFTFIAILGTFIYDIFDVFISSSHRPNFAWFIATLICVLLVFITLRKFRSE